MEGENLQTNQAEQAVPPVEAPPAAPAPAKDPESKLADFARLMSSKEKGWLEAKAKLAEEVSKKDAEASKYRAELEKHKAELNEMNAFVAKFKANPEAYLEEIGFSKEAMLRYAQGKTKSPELAETEGRIISLEKRIQEKEEAEKQAQYESGKARYLAALEQEVAKEELSILGKDGLDVVEDSMAFVEGLVQSGQNAPEHTVVLKEMQDYFLNRADKPKVKSFLLKRWGISAPEAIAEKKPEEEPNKPKTAPTLSNNVTSGQPALGPKTEQERMLSAIKLLESMAG